MAYKKRRASTKRRKRTRKKRRNPTRHRPVAYSVGRGKKKRMYRSPKYRLKPKRINRRKSRRRRVYRKRRNPQFRVKQYFGKARMMNAVALLAGIGGAAGLKAVASKMIDNEWFDKLFGLAAIVLGATLNIQGKKKEIKAVGTGMVVFGLYDVVVSNIPMLAAYLPTIGKPAFISGDEYGRQTYNELMGAGISQGAVEVVGGNISTDMTPEIVGDEMDLAEALEMAA